MDTITTVAQFCADNWALIALAAGAVLAVVKRTAWGQANAEALGKVVEAIEALTRTNPEAAKAAKASVYKAEATAAPLPKEHSPAWVDALRDAVARADEGKQKPKLGRVLAREALRGLPRLARLLLKVLVVCALVGGALTAATACRTITHPDGTVVREPDTDLILALTQIAQTELEAIREQRAEAEAADDPEEAARLERRERVQQALLDALIARLAGTQTDVAVPDPATAEAAAEPME
jgi:hypothetical protein